jgi:hypothetical protein
MEPACGKRIAFKRSCSLGRELTVRVTSLHLESDAGSLIEIELRELHFPVAGICSPARISSDNPVSVR